MASTLPILFKPDHSKLHGEDLEIALEALFRKADDAIIEGVNVLILSARGVMIPRAMLQCQHFLACAGLHHHLIRNGTRTKVSLVIESGEPQGSAAFRTARWVRCRFDQSVLSPGNRTSHDLNVETSERTPRVACKNFLKGQPQWCH